MLVKEAQYPENIYSATLLYKYNCERNYKKDKAREIQSFDVVLFWKF